MSIREFVKFCAKKAKSFMIRCWKKAKQVMNIVSPSRQWRYGPHDDSRQQ